MKCHPGLIIYSQQSFCVKIVCTTMRTTGPREGMVRGTMKCKSSDTRDFQESHACSQVVDARCEGYAGEERSPG